MKKDDMVQVWLGLIFWCLFGAACGWCHEPNLHGAIEGACVSVIILVFLLLCIFLEP